MIFLNLEPDLDLRVHADHMMARFLPLPQSNIFLSGSRNTIM
jgi:hypothetical protein